MDNLHNTEQPHEKITQITQACSSGLCQRMEAITCMQGNVVQCLANFPFTSI